MNTGALRMARSDMRVAALPWAWITAAIVVIALIERALLDTTPDVSWLLSIGERMLAGERPYIDFIEANPPASIYLYLPAILLARATGLSPEFVVGGLVFATAAASVWISARILLGGVIKTGNVRPLAAVFAFVLLVLPATTFAQREHFALIFFLPVLAVAALRASRAGVNWAWALAAGTGAGLTAIIKPHFILPVVLVAMTCAFCARSWRPVFALENWIAAALAVGYGVFVASVHPAFFYEWMPVITEVYVSQKAAIINLLSVGATPFWFGALLVVFVLKRGEALASPFILLLAAAVGFFLAFILQFKGLPYHSYPPLALMFAAALVAAGDRAEEVKREWLTLPVAAAAIAGLVAATFSFYAHTVDTRAFLGTIQASVSRPKVMNISGYGLVSVGFPLTRQLGGNWVGSTCGQWITVGALSAKDKTNDPETIARLNRYIERDRAMLVEDIRSKKPDIILVDRIRPDSDSYAWAKKHADLSAELDNYRSLAEINGVLILRRKVSRD